MLNEHPRQQLRLIITQYGQTVCHDAKRCEALLRDYCPEHKRELNLLIAALKEGVPQQLLKASPHVGIEFTLKTLTAQLHDNLGTAEHFAYWAVETWALSLNVLVQPIEQTVQVVQPTVQIATPKVQIPQRQTAAADWTCPVTGMEFIKIPKGSFMMGSPEDEEGRNDDETLHHVNIRHDFYLGKYLVIEAQWEIIMGDNPLYFKGATLPVKLNWEETLLFISQLSFKTGQQYRLPTEAEWEYACRAGTNTPFYTGYVIKETEANFNFSPLPVGSYPPNPWGLYDMVGNEFEWTASIYDENYKFSEQVADSSSDLHRVIRSVFSFDTNSLRSADRNNSWLYDSPISIRCGNGSCGFRLVRL